MIEKFFNYEIQNCKEDIIVDCKIHKCYANIGLISTICMMYTISKLRTYIDYVEHNRFIQPCTKKHILHILCQAKQKKNRLCSFFIRYIRKSRVSYVTTDLSLNPLS